MSVTDVQRDIRRTRALRVAAFLAAALNAVMLAVNTPHGGLVALILAPFSAAAVIGCVVMIVRQTRPMAEGARDARASRGRQYPAQPDPAGCRRSHPRHVGARECSPPGRPPPVSPAADPGGLAAVAGDGD